MAVTELEKPSPCEDRGAAVPTFVRDDLYEERDTGGAGIAVFATSCIASGTRLFCEQPLIAVPGEATQLGVFRAVAALPGPDQQAYWELAACSKPSKDLEWITELRQSSGEDESFNALVEAHERAWSIYETNRFNMRFPNGDRKFGVFYKAARLNHSCSPNVFHRYNPLINRLTIHALRDIQPGEELNTSYIDICHPTATRRQILKDWGFKCQCSACESSDSQRDLLSKRIEDVMVKLRKREDKVKSRPHPWEAKEYSRSMALIEKGLRLMEEHGMSETDTSGYLLSLAATYGARTGRHAEATEWAEKLVDVEMKCLGDDSNEYRAAVELGRRISEGSWSPF
ncbi:hypothetical protein PFICI_05558 [Pestalotiopsis fici W106-1]|uniref:SET domain-containing protein n=1 Tax=Pestalotiopsis fici (strain W106-1 / CGMCC3.15140) TaxID=1229662 RepID=W3XE36_PESFW|nr:uncharacterized protein PFICI_05558 [Pestalotiopsis fici W106-1]ETS83682.1 hypothetical protein PFICI_05558 [Pestalotiopsis fici W106-1]